MSDEAKLKRLVAEAINASIEDQLRLAAGLLEAGDNDGLERLANELVRIAHERLSLRVLLRQTKRKEGT